MSKKEKEPTVNAPFYLPKAEKICDLEKYKFFEISKKIRRHFSKFIMVIGGVLCIVVPTCMLTLTELQLHNPLLLDTMIFLGITNLICGLLLLTIE
ncbi:MAG: hypothetical protein ACOC6H_02415 [Thermoproteota archaeon]